MNGFWFYRNQQHHNADKAHRPVGISQTIFPGAPVVLTSVAGVATLNAVNVLSLRALLAADIAALYQEGGTNVGIFGIAPYGVKTDASCIANAALPGPVTLAGNQPIYAVPSIPSVGQSEAVQGRAQAVVDLANDMNLFGGFLWQNTTVTEGLKDVLVGIKISTIGGVPYYFWDSAATTKIARIEEVDVNHPMFNQAATANVADTTHYSRCPVYVKVLRNYQQATAAANYSTQ